MAYTPAATDVTEKGVHRSTLQIQRTATGAVDAAGNPTATAVSEQVLATDINRILEIVNRNADILDGLLPDAGGGTGGNNGTGGGTGTSATETVVLTTAQISSGITLGGTPTSPASTTLSHSAAGPVPYGANTFTVAGDLLTFAASFQAQLLDDDVLTIIWI